MKLREDSSSDLSSIEWITFGRVYPIDSLDQSRYGVVINLAEGDTQTGLTSTKERGGTDQVSFPASFPAIRFVEKIDMKNPSSFLSRLGSNQILDLKNQLHLSLPQGYRIYNQLPGIWLGGSENGTTYLHIERISAQALEMSQSLAGGDLDIQVFPKGKGQTFEAGIVGQAIHCQLRRETLSGIWLRVAFSQQDHYLILLAAKDLKLYTELEDAAMYIADRIRNRVPELIS